MDKDERKHISNITDEEVSDLDDAYDFRDYRHDVCKKFKCTTIKCENCPVTLARITYWKNLEK